MAEKAYRFARGAVTNPQFPHSQWRRYLQPDQEPQLFGGGSIDFTVDALEPYGQTAGCSGSYLDKCLLADQNYYLPADMLVKADMMSMAHGLEVRVPFLDRKVMDFASELSPSLLVPLTGPDKKLLRTVLGKFHTVPKLNKLPKRGFNVPVASMLRSQLKMLGDDLLSRNADILGPNLKPDGVRQLWLEHQASARNNGYALWALLTLATWKSSLAN
jgi:asparagine synthase (glutamine-hydrolysing)